MKDLEDDALTTSEPAKPGSDEARRSLPARSRSSGLAEADGRFREDLENAARFFEASLARSTRRAYAAAWARFVEYCTSRRREALPAGPETVAGYLSSVASEYASSTLRQHLAAIRYVHRRKFPGEVAPTKSALVENVLAGIVRSPDEAKKDAAAPGRSESERSEGDSGKNRRSRQVSDKAEPLRTRHLKTILEVLPGRGPAPPKDQKLSDYAGWLRGLRDRALLLAGYAGALRRSEISALHVEDLSFHSEGCLVYIGRSKTDQIGTGEEVAIAAGESAETCPVEALRRWLGAAEIDTGPVFRGVRRNGRTRPGALTGRSISTVVSDAAKAASITPGRLPGSSERRRFSGHSLRAGHITEATSRGASDHLVMQQSRHVDRKTFDGYVRPEKLLSNSSSRHLGL